MKVGVLALQGDFREHSLVLGDLGAEPVEVRHLEDLVAVDALVLPGGESTTLSMLLRSSGLEVALRERLAEGMPALGTCAGMILLASQVIDGRADQLSLGAVDIAVRRNAFGRQVDSFESDLEVASMPGGTFPAVFIRAPVVERVGADVEVLAELPLREGGPVLCRQGRVLVSSFHPELSADLRLHQLFLTTVDQGAR